MSRDGRVADLRRSCRAAAFAQVARMRLAVTRRVFGKHAARRVRAQVAWGLLYIHARYGTATERPSWYRDGRRP